jgi:outer membrane scaffolding protein for murein synthesis (MipA/OmpV family)
MNKRPLQVVTAALGLIPLVTGAVAMLGVDDPLYATIGLPRSALLDSNLRFFAGIWLGLGLTLLWVVPSIERQGTLFRVVWGSVFLGGVGRLLSLASLGTPPAPFIGFTMLEIVGAPVFVYWQHRLARSHVQRADAGHTDPLFSRSSRMRSTVIGVLALALSGELAAQGRPPSSGAAVTVGAAAVIVPEYPGSDQYRVLPFPMAQVAGGSHSSYLAPSTTGLGIALGAYALRTPRFSLAGEVGVQDSRPASRTDALAGTDDLDRVATVGASLGYRAGPAEARVGVSQGLNDGGGFLGSARFALTRPFGRLVATAGVGATFADGRQMRREFGVTELEASRRQALIDTGDDRLDPEDGLAYRPDGGLRHVGASLSLMYPVSQRWSVIGFGGVDRLSEEAADSPLVRRREQFMGGLGLGFRL